MSNDNAGGNESWHTVEKGITLNFSNDDPPLYDTAFGIKVAVPPWEALVTAIILGRYTIFIL